MYAMGKFPCKKQCSIATFFLVIQPCLKILAESFNSSNEARGTAVMPNEDDDRVLGGNTLPDGIPAPDDSHTFQRPGRRSSEFASRKDNRHFDV